MAGTSIGGGMLALPVLTSLGGFLPSLVIYLLCWLFMASTGLLFLEISLWLHEEANIISMAEKTLGNWGKLAAWGLYLFLFYCLTLAYIVGSGNMASDIFGSYFPSWMGSLIFVLIFSPFVYAGSKLVGKFNFLLMGGLIISFLGFIALGYSYIDTEHLRPRNWTLSLLALPVSFTSFAFQGIIPTLSHYMNYNPTRIRKAILIGSFLPLCIYALWEFFILGIVPTNGPGGLAEALEMGQTAVVPLQYALNTQSVFFMGQLFAFFALLTSFFGVTLGLMDFLADGFKIQKNHVNKAWIFTLVFVPPTFIACLYPHIFLKALDYAGGFGCALLLGLLPIMMVWRGRYKMGLKSEYALPGGKPVLLLLSGFVLFEIACELYFKFQI